MKHPYPVIRALLGKTLLPGQERETILLPSFRDLPISDFREKGTFIGHAGI